MLKKILILIAFLAMIFVNAMANILPLGGKTTGQVSAKYQNLFTPAPITFSIWGVIYVLVAVFVVLQFIPEKDISRPYGGIAFTFVLTCIFNIAWMFCWHYDKIAASVVMMLGLLLSLIILNGLVGNAADYAGIRKLIPIGFQVYLGWICAATIANISAFLKSIGWNGFEVSAELWTVLVILAGMIIGVLFILISHQIFSPLAIVWAYVGILIRHIGKAGYGMQYGLVVFTLIVSIAVLLMLFPICVKYYAKS